MTPRPDDRELQKNDLIAAILLVLLAIIRYYRDAMDAVDPPRATPKKRRNLRPGRGDPEYIYTNLMRLDEKHFQRIYRIKRLRFFKIVADLGWERKKDALLVNGIYPEVKIAAALRQLGVGLAPVQMIDIYGMGEETARCCLVEFLDCFLEKYEEQYLKFDLLEVVKENERVHGVPGLLGSLDCTHVDWFQCPTGHRGSYQGRSGKPSIILEAVGDCHRRVVHFFWGVPGAQNDINVLRSSRLIDKFLTGEYPSMDFELGGEKFNKPWMLTDGIYPKWAVFCKSVGASSDPRWQHFKVMQERWRKDIECCFGIIKKCWQVLGKPLVKRKPALLSRIVRAVLVLHNMCVEDRLFPTNDDDDRPPPRTAAEQVQHEESVRLCLSLREERSIMNALQDPVGHERLMNAVATHCWQTREQE